MPAHDRYHDIVRRALMKDGWTITHDPYRIEAGGRNVYVDLAAERLLAAERGDDKIAVEIKPFLGESDIRDFEQAIGQFVVYRFLMEEADAERQLLLAIPDDVFYTLLQEPIARPAVDGLPLKIIVFDPEEEEIVEWIR
jgi:hypothetical protein